MPRTMPTETEIAGIVGPLFETRPGVLPPGFGAVVGVAIAPNQSQLIFNFRGNLKAVDGSALTLDGDTAFAIGSVSKTFTATLFARDVAQNGPPPPTLGSSTPAGARLVGTFFRGITLRSLATYSSGLPEDSNTPGVDRPEPLIPPYTVNRMFEYLSTNPFRPAQPGQYAYSNLGFALLGAAVAARTGQHPLGTAVPGRAVPGTPVDPTASSYETVLRQRITEPLGFSFRTLDFLAPHTATPGTTLPPDPRGLPSSSDRLLQSYHGVAPATFQEAIQYPAYNPAGGLVMGGTAFMRWLQYNLGIFQNSPLTPLLEQTLTPSGVDANRTQQVCLGWFRDRDQQLLHKNGGTLGFSSLVSLSRGSSGPGGQPAAGVFILINRRPSDLATATAQIWDKINKTSGTKALENLEPDATS